MRNKELNIETVLSPAYRQIWDNSLLGVMVLNKEGIVLYINRILTRTDDLQDVDILGKKMVDFYPHDADEHLSIKVIQTGKPIIKKTIIYYTNENKLVNSLCSGFPLYSKGKVEGVIHFALNLQTSQKLLEQYATEDDHISFKNYHPKKSEIYTFDSIIGNSQVLKNAITYAKANSQTDFPALIWAETGCGKELFAQSMHYASPRANKPFIPINCAAIPDNLLETTLFGTSKGAFTGAIEKAGLLEKAEGGTLLLDELNSMSLELQAKLLRVIQEKKVRRVGAHQEILIDVKFISTCNISPSQALEKNAIRLDLFYRLAVVVIEIPPLQQRKSDIPILCNHFLSKWAGRSSPKYIRVSDEVYSIFENYQWPGNVRELEHTLKSCLTVIEHETTIYARHLSPYFMSNYRSFADGSSTSSSPLTGMTPQYSSGTSEQSNNDLHDTNLAGFTNLKNFCLNTAVDQFEMHYIKNALKKAGYNISKAGRLLNLSPQTLRYKINKLGIEMVLD